MIRELQYGRKALSPPLTHDLDYEATKEELIALCEQFAKFHCSDLFDYDFHS